jgi:phosphoribosylglycinamide formyltransferase-1
MRNGGMTLVDDERPVAAILASGNGTNALNLIGNVPNAPPFPQIRCVISDNADAPVLTSAARLGVESAVVPFVRTANRAYKDDKVTQETELLRRLRLLEVNWLFLSGYMRILSPGFLKAFGIIAGAPNRIINIHPSLLPAFPGKDSYADAYAVGVTEHGATVHFVDDGVDTGPIIAQRTYAVPKGMPFDEFKAHGLALEHDLYLEAMHILFAGAETR